MPQAPQTVPDSGTAEQATAEQAAVAAAPLALTDDAPAQPATGSQPWDGAAADTQWYDRQPEADCYTISTAAQLAGLAKLVNEGNSFSNKTVLLGASIDLNGQEWTPIGGTDTGKTFAGAFDGQGQTISNLKITRGLENTGANNRVGLFGSGTGAGKIQNFTLHNAEVSGCLYVAAVLGGSEGVEAKVDNVRVTGRVNIRGWWFAGGILGKGHTTVTNCTVEGDGAVTPCETTCDVQAETVTFVTPHFSRYAIAYDESLLPVAAPQQAPAFPESAQGPQTVETAAGGFSWPPVLAAAAAAGVILVLAARRYKKTH